MSMPYLQLRKNGVYYFRLRVPNDLLAFSDIFGGPMIHRSLKTRDRKLARMLVHGQVAKYELVMALLRSGLLPVEQIRSIAEMLIKGGEPTPEATSKPAPRKRRDEPRKDLRLSRLIELYIREHAPTWTKKTKAEYDSEFNVLLRLLGNRYLRSLDRESCVEFRDVLLKLPPNVTKSGAWEGKTLRQLAAMEFTSTMSPATANKYLVLLSSTLKWAVRQDYMAKNPAEGLKIPVRHRASSERAIYSLKDLQRVVDNLPRAAQYPEQFWIPLIAMYSGLRQGEICQLETRDVREIEGILCFDVNAGRDKELKTPASIRLVPVHPVLIRLGFHSYMQTQLDKQQERLWSNLTQDEFGYWTREFGRWYRLFNLEFVTEEPKKCFHSFRHTFADQLKQSDVQDVLISELLGHANPNISTGRYGKPYHLDKLLAAVELVDYGITLPKVPPFDEKPGRDPHRKRLF